MRYALAGEVERDRAVEIVGNVFEIPRTRPPDLVSLVVDRYGWGWGGGDSLRERISGCSDCIAGGESSESGVRPSIARPT